MVKWLKKRESNEASDAWAEAIKQRLLTWGEPSDQMRARIWERVRASTSGVPHTSIPAQGRRVFHALRYAILVMVVLLGFLGSYVGVVLAEGDSLPGEPFYPLERTAEAVLLSLTPQTRRCAMELRLLENRVYEIQATLNLGRRLPGSLMQETMLLVGGLPETLNAVPAQRTAVVNALASHHDTLVALNERHPGILELIRLIEAFENALDQLREAQPPS